MTATWADRKRREAQKLAEGIEWQRRRAVIRALLPYSGPRSQGWSTRPPARIAPFIPLQRPSLAAAERVAAAEAAAERRRIEIPQQRAPLPLERRGASQHPPPRTDAWTEQRRQPDGRFGSRVDIDNNRGGRG